jgi:hypothetical protein
MKIEMFEKKTGKVVATKEARELKSFMYYWTMQCNSKDYGYRVIA